MDNFFGSLKDIFIDGQAWKTMLTGLGDTLIISFGALLIGVAIGTILAVFRVVPSNNIIMKLLSKVVSVYITVIRGTPVMVQLLIAYFIIFANAFSGFEYKGTLLAIIVFGINSSAYVAEIIRGGILAVDKGQMEAGRSLGLNYSTTMSKIILPQAIKNIIPALGNELIVLIKETSIAGFVAVFELTRAARAIVADYYNVSPYIVLAAIYLVIVMIATAIVNAIERRLRKGDSH